MTFSGDDGPVLLSMPPPPPPVVACGFVQPGLLLPHPMHMHSMQMQPTPAVAAHLVFPGQTLQPPPPMPAHPEECRVEVRDVWAVNLWEELFHIHSLMPSYPGVCIDTMFPSTVHGSHTPRHLRPPRESYAVVKRHVDELRLLQLGLALFGPSGQCPVIWQFNFRGFDAGRDPPRGQLHRHAQVPGDGLLHAPRVQHRRPRLRRRVLPLRARLPGPDVGSVLGLLRLRVPRQGARRWPPAAGDAGGVLGPMSAACSGRRCRTSSTLPGSAAKAAAYAGAG